MDKQSVLSQLNDEDYDNPTVAAWALQHVYRKRESGMVFAWAWFEQLQKEKSHGRVLKLFDLAREMISTCRVDHQRIVVAAFLHHDIMEQFRMHSENFTERHMDKMIAIMKSMEEFFPVGYMSTLYSILEMRRMGADELADEIFRAHENRVTPPKQQQPRRQTAPPVASSSTERRQSVPLAPASSRKRTPTALPIASSSSRNTERTPTFFVPKTPSSRTSAPLEQQNQSKQPIFVPGPIKSTKSSSKPVQKVSTSKPTIKPIQKVTNQETKAKKRWHPSRHLEILTNYFREFPKEFGCQFFTSNEKISKFLKHCNLEDELNVESVKTKAHKFNFVKSEVKKEKNPSQKRGYEGPDLNAEPVRKMMKEVGEFMLSKIQELLQN